MGNDIQRRTMALVGVFEWESNSNTKTKLPLRFEEAHRNVRRASCWRRQQCDSVRFGGMCNTLWNLDEWMKSHVDIQLLISSDCSDSWTNRTVGGEVDGQVEGATDCHGSYSKNRIKNSEDSWSSAVLFDSFRILVKTAVYDMNQRCFISRRS
jgi:hypothetical protein